MERLDYLKEVDEFYYVDIVGFGIKEIVYYFQEGGKKNTTFKRGGVIMIPTEQENNLPVFFYQNEKRERFFESEEFPQWFLTIAQQAAKTYQARTRLRHLLKEEGK